MVPGPKVRDRRWPTRSGHVGLRLRRWELFAKGDDMTWIQLQRSAVNVACIGPPAVRTRKLATESTPQEFARLTGLLTIDSSDPPRGLRDSPPSSQPQDPLVTSSRYHQRLPQMPRHENPGRVRSLRRMDSPSVQENLTYWSTGLGRRTGCRR